MESIKKKCIKAEWLTPLIPTLKRQRQEDAHEFKFSLVYVLSSKPARATW